jgi:hypothetical protein
MKPAYFPRTECIKAIDTLKSISCELGNKKS